MNSFKEVIREKSDEELVEIVVRSQEYQPEFVEEVKTELREVRNIQPDKHSDKFNELVKREQNERSISIEPQTGILGEQTDCLGQTVPSISVERASDSGQTEEKIVEKIYEFAANLLFKENQSKQNVINELMNNGIDAENAKIVVSNLLSSRNERADKDMLYGALWCIGGTIATVADFGYIFWGAIVFGAIQFFRGLISRS